MRSLRGACAVATVVMTNAETREENLPQRRRDAEDTKARSCLGCSLRLCASAVRFCFGKRMSSKIHRVIHAAVIHDASDRQFRAGVEAERTRANLDAEFGRAA